MYRRIERSLIRYERGLLGRPHVGLADRLHQRHARAVDVQEAVAGPVLVLAMKQLGHVLLEVDARDGYGLLAAVSLDHEPAAGCDRLVVLGDLIPLHQVGVGVVLAVELRIRRDIAVQGQPGRDDDLDRSAVDDREHAGHSQADLTHIRVRLGVLISGAARAEHLALGQELSVNLQPNDRLVLHITKTPPALNAAAQAPR